MKKTLKTVCGLIMVVGILIISFVLFNSKKKAEQVAWPIMEKCWNNETTEIVSLTERPNFREGLNWRVGVRYTKDGFPAILENAEYGYTPEILVGMFSNEIVWKHFTEIDESEPGCGNY